jgi:iron-sulfur cluster assembly protein
VDGEKMGLRIVVEKGGCAGMQYEMRFDVAGAEDIVNESEGARVLVDAASARFLEGASLDYCDDLVGTGFRLHNPNAARSCGCGTSFEPLDRAEPGENSGAVQEAGAQVSGAAAVG